MTNPTSNFGWQMPTSTDLVTDLPADFAVFGQAVDTSMADLKGGTTGQILSKATATDMDFVWTSPSPGDITGVTAGTGISGGGTSGDVTVTNSMATAITTAGDLIKGTGAGTFDRLGIGSSGQVLTVTAGAPAWAAPASGSLTLLSTTTLTGTSVSVTGISGSYTNLQIRIDDLGTGTTAGVMKMELNTNTTAYLTVGLDGNTGAVFTGGAIALSGNRNMKDTGGDNTAAVVNIYNYAGTNAFKAFDMRGGCTNPTGGDGTTSCSGIFQSTSAVTSVQVKLTLGATFDGSPSMKIYGVN